LPVKVCWSPQHLDPRPANVAYVARAAAWDYLDTAGMSLGEHTLAPITILTSQLGCLVPLSLCSRIIASRADTRDDTRASARIISLSAWRSSSFRLPPVVSSSPGNSSLLRPYRWCHALSHVTTVARSTNPSRPSMQTHRLASPAEPGEPYRLHVPLPPQADLRASLEAGAIASSTRVAPCTR